MKIDLHIHSHCSDGLMTVEEIFREASIRHIGIISITDHDNIECQEEAKAISGEYDIKYIHGLELSVSFSHPLYNESKPINLDFLAYEYDIHYQPLIDKLLELRNYRKKRGELILERVNKELAKKNIDILTNNDLDAIESTVEGSLGRPHIADYLVKKGLVNNRQEAFDQYLVKCNIPKMKLLLSEASELVKGAGGKLVIAHPNHPRGTSLIKFTPDIEAQQEIISETIMPYIEGIECWHSEHDPETIVSYIQFAKKNDLIITGGSDCHQQPVLMGSVDIPLSIAGQFDSLN